MEISQDVWAELKEFQCPARQCPSKKPFEVRCSEDDEPLFISQLGVVKCRSGDHQGDLCRWEWTCGSEYHQGKYFENTDLEKTGFEGYSFALSMAVQLVVRMGSAWVAELISSTGKNYNH